MQLVLGKEYFYANSAHKIRATHGMICYKEMKLDEFLTHARKLEKKYGREEVGLGIGNYELGIENVELGIKPLQPK